MKLLKVLFVILPILLTFSTSSYARWGTKFSGNDWSASNFDMKVAYVMGVVDALSFTDLLHLADSSKKNYPIWITGCIPKSVTVGQIVKIVDKYLKERPDKLHQYMVLIFIDAISEAFNCQYPNINDSAE